jgi:hypothetical protein
VSENNRIQKFLRDFRSGAAIGGLGWAAFTRETRAYLRTEGKCSVCHAPARIGRRPSWVDRHIRLKNTQSPNYRLLAVDGTELPGGLLSSGEKVVQIQCKNCGHTWPCFQWDASKPAVPQIEIIPGKKTEKLYLPRDQWTIDNSQSSVQVEYERGASRTWSKTVNVTYEEATKDIQGISISAPVGGGTVTLNHAVETQLRQAYTASDTGSETRTHTVRGSVPPHKKVRVMIEWTTSWQEGVIKLHDPTGNKDYDPIPFKVAIELRARQLTEDIA